MAGLVLLTNSFPYGGGEAYLESEVPFYNSTFDEVTIAALNIKREQLKRPVRKLNGSAFRLMSAPFANKLTYLFKAPLCLFDSRWRAEVATLGNEGRLTFSRLVRLTVCITRAHHEAAILRKQIIKNSWFDYNGEGIIYSYRFDYQPYVGILIHDLFPNYKLVSRCHGYDLYECNNPDNYLPLRDYYASCYDRVFTVCKYGERYLKNSHPKFTDIVETSYLGTNDHGLGPVVPRNPVFRIVSCSNVVSVKRLDRIVDILSSIDDIRIQWTHYGAGDQLAEIKRRSSELLSDNIDVEFRGFLSNDCLLSEYEKIPYHLFINVSESEGLPVSIMEAMSFGIPCLATDVGGTSEIVKTGCNGWLLTQDQVVLKAPQLIRDLASAQNDEYLSYRLAARSTWKEFYSSEKNYSAFMTTLRYLADRG